MNDYELKGYKYIIEPSPYVYGLSLTITKDEYKLIYHRDFPYLKYKTKTITHNIFSKDNVDEDIDYDFQTTLKIVKEFASDVIDFASLVEQSAMEKGSKESLGQILKMEEYKGE